MIILTIIADIGCLILVRGLRKRSTQKQVSTCSQNQIQNCQKHILNETPMRSTILNLGIIMVWAFTIPLGIFGNLNEVDKINYGIAIAMVSWIIISPTIIFLTFRVNKQNSRVDQDVERERKRQVEIQDAKQKRAERFARALAISISGTEGSEIFHGLPQNKKGSFKNIFMQW